MKRYKEKQRLGWVAHFVPYKSSKDQEVITQCVEVRKRVEKKAYNNELSGETIKTCCPTIDYMRDIL